MTIQNIEHQMAQSNSGFKASCAKTIIFWANKVNTIATYALAPCVTRSTATITLNMHDELVFVFNKKEFQQPDLQINSAWQGLIVQGTYNSLYWSNAALASISRRRRRSDGIAPSSRAGSYWLLHGDLKGDGGGAIITSQFPPKFQQ